jgi:hypothetical protein
METFSFFAIISIFMMLTILIIQNIKFQIGVYQQIKRLEDDVKSGFNDCMMQLSPSRIHPEVCTIREDKPIVNFPKAAKEAKRSYSAEHKAKLSAARKAFWEKKKAAEQLLVTQLPMQNPPNVS